MKKATLSVLLLGFLVSQSFTTLSQDEKYIVLDKNDLKALKKQPRKQILVENDYVIKFDPTRMLVGELGFSYEKVMGINSSVEFEFGPTISNLYDNNHYYYYSSNSYHTQSGIGVLASAAFRFYPMQEALNGFYVSPKLRYKSVNTMYIDQTGTLSDETGTKNQYSFMFNMGMQRWLSNQFSLDLYAGLGLGYSYNRDFIYNTFYDPITSQYTSEWTKQKYQGARVVANIGLKVGIGNTLKK